MKSLLGVLFLIGSVAQSLKLYRVHVPQYRILGENALFECDFDLHGSKLYAVKWYKDDEEFFRYVPKFRPPIYTHQVDGVIVDVSESDAKKVLLKTVDLKSTGVYRCEVSEEAPSFFTEHGEGRMTVVYLPKGGPQITGNLQEEYSIGDILDLNCTTYLSYPPAFLTWYINDLPVYSAWITQRQHHQEFLQSTETSRKHSSIVKSTLVSTTSNLKLTLSAGNFGNSGFAKIQCISSISTDFPWEDTKEISLGNFTKKPHIKLSTNQSSLYELEQQHKYNHLRKDNREHLIFNHHHHHHQHTRWHQERPTPFLPQPYIFNATSFVTVRGSANKIHLDLILIVLFEVICLNSRKLFI